MTKSKKTYAPALLCLAVMGLAGCGGGSSDSVLTGSTTATTKNSAGCYDLDWEFKPGSSSKTTLRYFTESPDGEKSTATVVYQFTAIGIQAPEAIPTAADAFSVNISKKFRSDAGRDYDYGITSYRQRLNASAFELLQTSERFGPPVIEGGIDRGPVALTRTNFEPALLVSTPALAVGQQIQLHRTGTWYSASLRGSGFDPSGQSFDRTESIKLVGIDTLTVPAGRYETCHFEHTDSLAPGELVSHWVIRGKGVTVKTITSGPGKSVETEVATAIEIDGQPF